MRKRRNPIVKPTFAEALDLLAHAEVHARFEPHKSNLCKRSFLNETTIKEHVQQLTETDADSAGRNSPTEEHCKSCEHNAKLTYNDLNLDKFPAGTDRRLSTSTSVPAARRLIGMFTVWMKA
ncbi:hypothetical protein quinque_006552 [Culex quinquefasciatus]